MQHIIIAYVETIYLYTYVSYMRVEDVSALLWTIKGTTSVEKANFW